MSTPTATDPRALAETVTGLAGVWDRKQLKVLADMHVVSLAPEEVPTVTFEAAQFAEAAKAVATAGELRLIELRERGAFGPEWVHPATGQVFEFLGTPGDLEVADPDSLVDALAKVGVPQDEIQRACFKVWKVSQLELSLIAQRRPEWREIIEDHRSRRKPGPPHLKAKGGEMR